MDIILIKIAKELEEFFEITAPDFELVLINSREEFDQISGRKTESWMDGWLYKKRQYLCYSPR